MYLFHLFAGSIAIAALIALSIVSFVCWRAEL